MKKLIIFGVIFPLLIACKNKQEPLFSMLPASESGIDFKNIVVENEQFNLYDFHNVYNGAGVAIGDINNDDLPDLYFAGNMSGDKIYLNKGNLHFQDITAQAGIIKQGWSTGVTMADVNTDGFLDIYVCKSGNYEGEGEQINSISIKEEQNLLKVPKLLALPIRVFRAKLLFSIFLFKSSYG